MCWNVNKDAVLGIYIKKSGESLQYDKSLGSQTKIWNLTTLLTSVFIVKVDSLLCDPKNNFLYVSKYDEFEALIYN